MRFLMVMYDCLYKMNNYTWFLHGLLPILGKWMVFMMIIPLLAGLYGSLKNGDYGLSGIYLVFLVIFAVLFAIMLMLGWEIIKFKLGVSA